MPAIRRVARPVAPRLLAAAAFAVAAVVAATAPTASAANVTWTGAVDGNWSTPGN